MVVCTCVLPSKTFKQKAVKILVAAVAFGGVWMLLSEAVSPAAALGIGAALMNPTTAIVVVVFVCVGMPLVRLIGPFGAATTIPETLKQCGVDELVWIAGLVLVSQSWQRLKWFRRTDSTARF